MHADIAYTMGASYSALLVPTFHPTTYLQLTQRDAASVGEQPSPRPAKQAEAIWTRTPLVLVPSP